MYRKCWSKSSKTEFIDWSVVWFSTSLKIYLHQIVGFLFEHFFILYFFLQKHLNKTRSQSVDQRFWPGFSLVLWGKLCRWKFLDLQRNIFVIFTIRLFSLFFFDFKARLLSLDFLTFIWSFLFFVDLILWRRPVVGLVSPPLLLFLLATIKCFSYSFPTEFAGKFSE